MERTHAALLPPGAAFGRSSSRRVPEEVKAKRSTASETPDDGMPFAKRLAVLSSIASASALGLDKPFDEARPNICGERPG